MIREICRDPFFLARKSEPATADDLSVAQDLLDTFDGAGCGQVIVHQRGKLAIDPAQIDCDYYDWRDGRSRAVNLYRGEYMSQYSWAEFKHSSLQSLK